MTSGLDMGSIWAPWRQQMLEKYICKTVFKQHESRDRGYTNTCELKKNSCFKYFNMLLTVQKHIKNQTKNLKQAIEYILKHKFQRIPSRLCLTLSSVQFILCSYQIKPFLLLDMYLVFLCRIHESVLFFKVSNRGKLVQASSITHPVVKILCCKQF